MTNIQIQLFNKKQIVWPPDIYLSGLLSEEKYFIAPYAAMDYKSKWYGCKPNFKATPYRNELKIVI